MAGGGAVNETHRRRWIVVKYKEVPGDAWGSQLNYQKALVRLAEKLIRFERLVDLRAEEEFFVMGMSIRIPQEEGEDYLITLRANAPTGQVVAFHAAASLREALEGLINRMSNKSLMWKADQYARGSGKTE